MTQSEHLRLRNDTVEVALDPVSLRGTIRLRATGDIWTLDILGTAGWLIEAPAPNHGYHRPRIAEAPMLERLPVPAVADLWAFGSILPPKNAP
jgi:hypothetical protein